MPYLSPGRWGRWRAASRAWSEVPSHQPLPFVFDTHVMSAILSASVKLVPSAFAASAAASAGDTSFMSRSSSSASGSLMPPQRGRTGCARRVGRTRCASEQRAQAHGGKAARGHAANRTSRAAACSLRGAAFFWLLSPIWACVAVGGGISVAAFHPDAASRSCVAHRRASGRRGAGFASGRCQRGRSRAGSQRRAHTACLEGVERRRQCLVDSWVWEEVPRVFR